MLKARVQAERAAAEKKRSHVQQLKIQHAAAEIEFKMLRQKKKL
jgi:hypothetical protein